jgi:hypothetical protein
MKWLLQTYTNRFNRRHRYSATSLAADIKRSWLKEAQTAICARSAKYVHLNPVRAKLVHPEEPLRTFQWSSYPAYLSASRPVWLRVDRVFGEYGIPGDTAAGRQRFEEVLEQRRWQADHPDWESVHQGWCIGSEEFRRQLLAQVSQQIGPNHFGPERRESAELKAARIMSEELAKIGVSGQFLCALAVSSRLAIARRLRSETK